MRWKRGIGCSDTEPAGRFSLLLLLCSALAAGESAAQPSAETIARGKALVVAGDCASCHTADPAKPFAGGRRIATPFGGVYAPNLTPDRETGLGRWSDEDFLRALRHGIAPDGSRYYPAFPYPNFTKLVREDILAIRAYLATLEPVRKAAPPPELLFPFNFRVVMRVWNWLFLKPGIIMPDQARGTAWNRGRYLVEGLGHCGACHTPKNFLGADKRDQAFAGNRVDGMFAPRLDGAERSGLKSWSADDIAEYLQSGRNAKSHAGQVMSEVVVNSTSKMSDGDIRAIAVYLKSLPAGAAGAGGHAALAGADGRRREDLPRRLHRLPRGRWIGRAAHLSAAARQRQSAIGRSAEHHPHHPRRRAKPMTTPRAPNKGSMPGYAKALRPGDRRCRDLHPQRLGQCRAGRDGGGGCEGAQSRR